MSVICGDDFLVLFQSEDWGHRCRAIIDSFAEEITAHFSKQDLQRGGYVSENRQGHRVLNAFVTVSLGGLKVEQGHYCSHHQIAAATSEAKKHAKRVPGNSLFIDRRSGPCVATGTFMPEPAKNVFTLDHVLKAATSSC